MLQAEANSTHTTRPRIAMGAFYVVSAVTVVVVAMWAVAVYRKDAETLAIITDGWEFVLAAILPFVGWLNQYFGILRDEHRNRLDAIHGQTRRTGIASILAKLSQ